MAVDFNNSRLILWLRSQGVVLGDVLTVGRLGVFLSPELLTSDAAKFKVSPVAPFTWAEVAAAKFCEPALMAMGAASVRALDFSDYEGAEILHDLNKPLPAELEHSCDVLFDSGSLEHVFNVPVALDNYIRLVRPGGWIVLDMPADGCCGHGFYQFSPELFYQYFDGRPGCSVMAVFAVEDEPLGQWYQVPSPASIGDRVYLHGRKPLHVYVVVRRLEEPLSEAGAAPVQVDYDHAWRDAKVGEETKMSGTQGGGVKGLIRSVFMRLMPIAWWRWSVIRNAKLRRRPFRLEASDLLKPVDPFSTRLSR